MKIEVWAGTGCPSAPERVALKISPNSYRVELHGMDSPFCAARLSTRVDSLAAT